jgi:hypothetical protein
MKKILITICAGLLLVSCAEEKTFESNGKSVTVQPYGWFDTSLKNDSINYKINTGNIVLSVIFSETIIVPIILTGDQLYEPTSLKSK